MRVHDHARRPEQTRVAGLLGWAERSHPAVLAPVRLEVGDAF